MKADNYGLSRDEFRSSKSEARNPKSETAARCPVLGVGISAVNLEMAVAMIDRWIERRERQYVCVTGVHGVIESQLDSELKRIHNRAGLVTPDGMPMVWLNRLRGNGHVGRVYGPDLMLAVCQQAAERGHRMYLYGGADGVGELLEQRLGERFAGLQIVGRYCPPFRALSPAEDQQIVDQINASGADIVWVGLSTPKQERWMARHRDQLHASVLIGVGAAFDFHAGLKRQAPRWIQKSGLEWLFRLACEPRRLAKRYLRNNPLFLSYLLMEWLHLRNFRLGEMQTTEEQTVAEEAYGAS